MTNGRAVKGSFRDPSGSVISHEGEILRQVNRKYQSEFDRFMESGLYDELVKRNLLIPHETVENKIADDPDVYKVIKPRLIPFISYPYEWCFSLMRDAALTTLQIQEIALEYDMTLKDASAYNIQHYRGGPILIDTLSFEHYSEGDPWVAYRQFCQHFLAPLTLISQIDPRLGHEMRNHIDGIPLDLASRLLPTRSRFRLSTAMHIHMHARSQKRHQESRESPKAGTVSRRSMLALLSSLRSAITGLKYTAGKSEWSDYYDDTNYSDNAMSQKEKVVSGFIAKVKPEIVWDLGANTGRFSRVSSNSGALTIAFDSDFDAVEKHYLECRKHKIESCIPLVMDLTNPSPSLGWQNVERDSLTARGPSDCAMALALIHHLAISNNVPFPLIAEYFRDITKSLIIEFVPKSDSQVSRLLVTRRDIFDDYTREAFEQAFERHFRIESRVEIEGTSRSLYLMYSRGKVEE